MTDDHGGPFRGRCQFGAPAETRARWRREDILNDYARALHAGGIAFIHAQRERNKPTEAQRLHAARVRLDLRHKGRWR